MNFSTHCSQSQRSSTGAPLATAAIRSGFCGARGCRARCIARGRCHRRTGPARRCSSDRHITLSEVRSRLYRRRSLQVKNHFSAFFKIYNIFTILRRSNLKILQNIVQKFVILKKFSYNFFNAKFLKSRKQLRKF